MAAFSFAELENILAKFPRVDLVHAPTPFKKLPNLSRYLGGPDIYIKRDDLTGLAFGGNKSRKLEYIIPDVLAKKADSIITWASLQSNWCLQTAAAAVKYGITPLLILFKTYDLPEEFDGNLLLDYILGAEIRFAETESKKVVVSEQAEKILNEVKAEQIAAGKRPYVAPIGGSVIGGDMELPLGAIAYTQVYLELAQQADAAGVDIDYVIHASGSGGTQAGLLVGAKALGNKTKVLGISVSDCREVYAPIIADICRDTLAALGLNLDLAEYDVQVLDEYLQDGYGIVNQDVSDMVRMMALQEGIYIDPVYTGKAIVALQDLIKKGKLTPEDKVVFVHTGGTAALFPNKHLLTKFLREKK